MGQDVKRTTICFKPELHKALRLKAAESSRSITDLVNTAVRDSIKKDIGELLASDDPRNEAQISHDKMVEQLKRDGAI